MPQHIKNSHRCTIEFIEAINDEGDWRGRCILCGRSVTARLEEHRL